ncbi:heavy metal translocating P-type ATPase [Cytobacillus sp. IB215665]|uniref:heavy metal translocating P-type ATPase n=1 Tax=Cytobacillus sp. IB215665 TaxID=3097357 RepID=UPI002A0F0FF4|nr:heavy metal translocating P-type ATPase [Cytobacillus sp. IB215665]MDX8365310.1 heavy metal translocating P-type ATPase [Cytobacillus sp. IB215665]
METSGKAVIEDNTQSTYIECKTDHTETFINKLQTHIELIAALSSGVLIFVAWLMDKLSIPTFSVSLYILAFLIGGFAKAKEGIEETIKNRELNVEMLMVFAAIGSASIGYWWEGAVLIFIFSLSGALETYTMNRSNREISSLMDLQPEEAILLVGDSEKTVHISELQIGDTILIKPGDRIPIDGEVLKGQTSIDQATITGESIPVSKDIGDEVFAGTVNLRGAILVKMTKHSEDTLFQKIIRLVQSAQSEKSPSQLFIEKYEGTYVKIVLITVLIMMFAPHYLFNWSWTETFYRAMILLVVASPCALVASIMPATLSAISNGAKKGILFKGGVHLEKLSEVKAIAFDKTGTLTRGKPTVTKVLVRDGLFHEDVITAAASLESHSSHPLAQAIVSYARSTYKCTLSQPDSLEDVAGWGVQGVYNNQMWKIGKADFVGSKLAEQFHGGIANQLADEGNTVVFIADSNGIAAIIALKDAVRAESIKAIQSLKALGIQTIMLTGDGEQTAKAIAEECQVNHYIAGCLPEAKVEHLKQLKNKYNNVAMVGDGINDAPALATANVGVAMGEGTDVALETADVVLMKNDLSKIAETIKLSQKMNRIVKHNIIFSIVVISLLILSNFLQVVNLPLGVIGHEGSTILVILNGLRLLKA